MDGGRERLRARRAELAEQRREERIREVIINDYGDHVTVPRQWLVDLGLMPATDQGGPVGGVKMANEANGGQR